MIKTFLPLIMLSLATPFVAEAKSHKHTKKAKKNQIHSSSSSSSSRGCCTPHEGNWAQFSIAEEQTVAPDEPVKWGGDQCYQAKCIEIRKSCTSEIILKQPGFYLVRYIVTGEVPTGEDVLQFAIDKNGRRVKHSTFAVADAESEAEKEVVGEVVVCVRKANSIIRLINKGPSVVELDPDVADDLSSIHNVTAEIFIQKLPD